MDQDGSEHNICSNREGLCPGKKQHGASGWKKISSMVKNLCEIRTVYLNTANKSRCFIDFERKCFGNFMHLLD